MAAVFVYFEAHLAQHLPSIYLPTKKNPATCTPTRSFHQSLFGRDAEFAAALAAPVALISARGDPLESVRDALASRADARGRALADQSVFVRMDDMTVRFFCPEGGGQLACLGCTLAPALRINIAFRRQAPLNRRSSNHSPSSFCPTTPYIHPNFNPARLLRGARRF